MDLELRTTEPVLRRRVETKREKLRDYFEFSRIARAAASPLNAVIDMASRVASCDIAVHISGEYGTGKELLGRAIHYSSPPFRTCICDRELRRNVRSTFGV